MPDIRWQRWLIVVASVLVVASLLACGGMEYAALSPGSNAAARIRGQVARTWRTVKNYLEDILQTILELVGLADCASPLKLAAV